MNTWTLLGRLGGDAEIKELQGGKVANFNVAADSYKKGANGEREKTTIWTRAKWFNPNDKMVTFLKKGCRVLLVGRPSADAYVNKAGELIAVQEMLVGAVEIIEFAKGEEANGGAPAPSGQQPQGQQYEDLPETDDMPF